MFKRLTPVQFLGVLLACAAVLALIGGIVTFFMMRNGTETPAPTAPTAAAAASPDEATAPASDKTALPSAPSAPSASGEQPTATAPAPVPAVIPDALQALLDESGRTASELQELGTGQLVVVDSEGSTAEVSFYERTETGWQTDEGLLSHGYVGANGTTAAMHEGGSATPQGLFHVGSAFYQDDAPQTGLDVFPITPDTYWVDDPDSPNYNQLVVGDDALGGDHAEHMSEISSYTYGFVIEYNMPPTGYAAGSAIFFHVSHDSPTLGCVTVSEQKVLAYLAKLDASKNPYILII